MKYNNWLTGLYTTLGFIMLHLEILTTFGLDLVPNKQVPDSSLKFPITPKELRRLRAKGLEILPTSTSSLLTNKISDEPSCEELRAMWRYYKRQSRAAELTNEISQLPDMFWGLPRNHQPSSFVGPFRSRNRGRLRPKGSSSDVHYGRVTYRQNSKAGNRRRRPLEEVIQTFGIQPKGTINSKSDDLVIHEAPPLSPTPESSFQILKDMYREERIQENSQQASSDKDNKDFGKVILSPPNGHDGRIANKPRELMTPFERIRFGQTGNLFNRGDDIESRKNQPPMFHVKRRVGFIGLPVLNPHVRLQPKHSSSQPSSLSSSSNDLLKKSTEKSKTGSTLVQSQPVVQSISAKLSQRSDNQPNFLSENADSLILPDYVDDSPLPINLMYGKDQFVVDDISLPCTEIEFQPCSLNSDCSCIGVGLYRCELGQCQILSFSDSEVSRNNDWGFRDEIWLSEPLEQSHLGKWENTHLPVPIILEDERNMKK